jgi:hypothetical protein
MRREERHETRPTGKRSLETCYLDAPVYILGIHGLARLLVYGIRSIAYGGVYVLFTTDCLLLLLPWCLRFHISLSLEQGW